MDIEFVEFGYWDIGILIHQEGLSLDHGFSKSGYWDIRPPLPGPYYCKTLLKEYLEGFNKLFCGEIKSQEGTLYFSYFLAMTLLTCIDRTTHLDLKNVFEHICYCHTRVVIGVSNLSGNIKMEIMAMKLAHGPLYVGDAKVHIQGHDL